MRLVDLKIEPKANIGWGSKTHSFGDDITQLYGPNGCGKTPMIHSIAYAMGYPVRYREDILSHCEAVVLKVTHGDKDIVFKRKIDSKDIHIECQITGEDESRIFYNEKDVSLFLLEVIGVSAETLTSNKNGPTPPYVSTFMPLFYVDQDSGYSSAYNSPKNFIKDQYAEMVRLALGIPVKHAYERKKHLIDKKKALESKDIAIVQKSNFIESLLNQSNADGTSSSEIERKLIDLRVKLDDLRTSNDAANDADSLINYMINEKSNQKNDIELKARDLKCRISDFNKIKNEIETEINTLSLNEEARRHFDSFSDICSNSGCQLFLTSSESYGKNLLYLRDQIKDLERNTKHQQERLDELKHHSEIIKREIEGLKSQLNDNATNGTSQSLVNTISEITKSIIDLQSEKEILDRIEEEKSSYYSLLNERETLKNDIASIEGGAGSSDLRVLEFRAQFKNKLVEWLDVLSTKNVSRSISIDASFNVLFGSEKVSQFSGSTLLRVVLALKAAFHEVYLSNNLNSMEFMIFDTPRQHDIETEHFAAFIKKLKKLVSGVSAQVIFSTTEYRYDIERGDTEWTPSFLGEEQNMFLGTISQLQSV